MGTCVGEDLGFGFALGLAYQNGGGEKTHNSLGFDVCIQGESDIDDFRQCRRQNSFARNSGGYHE